MKSHSIKSSFADLPYHEPNSNSEMDTSGRFFPRVHLFPRTILQRKRSHKLRATSCKTFTVSIRHRTHRRKSLATTESQTYPQSHPAVLGPQEAVQWATHNEHERLWMNDQRETARHALLHQPGEFLAVTHQYEAAARQHLVSTLARNNEARNKMFRCNFGNSNMKQTRDFPKTQGTVVAILSRSKSSSSRSARNFGNIRSMETRGASTRLTYRSESSSVTHGRLFATISSRICWTTSAPDRIGSGNTAQNRETLEESRAANSAVGQKLIDFEEVKQNIFDKYDATIMTEQKLVALLLRNRTNLVSHESRTSKGQQLVREWRSELMKLIARIWPERSWGKDWNAKDRDSKSAKIYSQHKILWTVRMK